MRILITDVYKILFEIFFLLCLYLELFAKIKKDVVSTQSQKPGLSITQDLNIIKKISNIVL